MYNSWLMEKRELEFKFNCWLVKGSLIMNYSLKVKDIIDNFLYIIV